MKFKERYEHLQAAAVVSSTGTPPHPTKKQKTHVLLRDLDSTGSDSDSDDTSHNKASSTPWLVEYERYMNTTDIIPPGMTVVAWWGVCHLSRDLFLCQ
jgi:hypothetical protein